MSMRASSHLAKRNFYGSAIWCHRESSLSSYYCAIISNYKNLKLEIYAIELLMCVWEFMPYSTGLIVAKWNVWSLQNEMLTSSRDLACELPRQPFTCSIQHRGRAYPCCDGRILSFPRKISKIPDSQRYIPCRVGRAQALESCSTVGEIGFLMILAGKLRDFRKLQGWYIKSWRFPEIRLSGSQGGGVSRAKTLHMSDLIQE